MVTARRCTQGLVKPATWPEGDVEVVPSQNAEFLDPRYPYPDEIVTHVGPHFAGWSFELDPVRQLELRLDPSMRIAWRMALAHLSEFSRTQPAQLHIRGPQMAFRRAPNSLVMKMTDSSTVPPRFNSKSRLRSASVTLRQR